MAIAIVVGLMSGIGIAFILEYLDQTIKTEKDIENILNLPVLGSIPLIQQDSINDESEINNSKKTRSHKTS
ncbi:hypothetical protein [Sinobaca sp. H24]|uniref:hypothetical protein n=1 Tax=Sinobaca sp. H24 TaxID=2923376 RepID=UPI00207A7A22|nr:hypothetical protein [Sinobaca sp. H24]